jgi:hypothetical protein
MGGQIAKTISLNPAISTQAPALRFCDDWKEAAYEKAVRDGRGILDGPAGLSLELRDLQTFAVSQRETAF